MAEGNHCTTKLLPPGICVGLASTGMGSDDDEDSEEHDPPIISLSKSSTDMLTGPPQRTELARLRPDLRKSSSTQRPSGLAGSTVNAITTTTTAAAITTARFSVLPAFPRQDRSSLGSGGISSLDTVVWREASQRPWSLSDDCCAGPVQPPEEHNVMGLVDGEGLPPGYPYCMDLQGVQGQGEGRERQCLSGCSLVGQDGVNQGLGISVASSSATLDALQYEGADRSRGGPETVMGVEGQAPVFLNSPLLGQGCRTNCADGYLQGNPVSLSLPYANANAYPAHGDAGLHGAGSYSGEGQRSPLLPRSLVFPSLVSSISQTSLDRHVLTQCCAPLASDSSSVSSSMAVAHASSMAPQLWPTHQGAVREAGTMTSRCDLRDVGVQTGSSSLGSPPAPAPTTPSSEPLSPPHSSSSQSSKQGKGGMSRELRAPHLDGALVSERYGGRSPMREVEWDDDGMTWEVYGAAVDPEELGHAIQKHLELQITEGKGQEAGIEGEALQQQQEGGKTCGTGRQMNGKKKKRVGLRMSLRRPGCCSRAYTMGD
ncbi:hypothetical protein ACEWY4_026013 [Coilia grayii]|uniref:G protein-regulated inducer of neurite outgrowth C-terminal domain-containing protein n=1 Tax=Coilia grayii TaxID=363190 RepID=A0ABD1ITM0_9TELE